MWVKAGGVRSQDFALPLWDRFALRAGAQGMLRVCVGLLSEPFARTLLAFCAKDEAGIPLDGVLLPRPNPAAAGYVSPPA